MRNGRWICVAVLLVLACRSDEKTVPEVVPKFTTTSLPCFVPKGTSLLGGGLAHMNLSGPSWCASVLQLFLQENPTVHIVSILPLEYPLEAVRAGADAPEAGTQELLVVHADRGRWPVASSLATLVSPCTVRGGQASGPSHCKEALEFSFRMSHSLEFWVPLTREPKAATAKPGTSELLLVERKDPAAPK